MKLSKITHRKFIETYPGNGRKILTPYGYKEILEVHKTIPYRKFIVETENNMRLECAFNHVIMDENYNEIYAKDSLNKKIQTCSGVSTVKEVTDTGIDEHMYDISIDSEDELYYSNGILSHNSGKSVTVAIYLAWLFLFERSMNIGIAANKSTMAAEFLDKTKKIFIELPVWMQSGITVWNKTYIENEANMRIITDSTSGDSFRGFTCAVVVVDETAFIKRTLWDDFKDSIFPSQSGLAWKKNILISTAKGQNHFYDIIKGAREQSNGYVNYEVNWKDVPRFKSNGDKKTPEEFQKEIVDKYGEVYFNQNYGCVSGSSVINIYNKETGEYFDTTIEELRKQFLETQGYEVLYIYENEYREDKIREIEKCKRFLEGNNVQNKFKILTDDGYKDFDNIISTGVNENLIFELQTSKIEVTKNHTFVVNGINVRADVLKIGDFLQTKTGLQKIISISESKSRTFDVLNVENHSYFANNILNHNCDFLGSSHTLISTDRLQSMKPKEVQEIRDGKLKIYHYPEKNHQYIMSVDPAKDGLDAFAVQVIDITDFNFKQVASANIQIDYLLMPEYIYDWCELYNFPYLIIENNEGAGQSIADQMYRDYEYQNLHFDTKTEVGIKNLLKSRKSYPGFRTTSKSRKQILNTMKLFIENDKLEINDSATISQFFNFIMINNKFQADDGHHDDLIMSLALVFAPFINTKNFEDMKILVKNIYNEDLSEQERVTLGESLLVGNFNCGTDEEYLEMPQDYWEIEEF